ncbi:hypothetical protein GCM10017687_10590 [Streptomyces echinatus]
MVTNWRVRDLCGSCAWLVGAIASTPAEITALHTLRNYEINVTTEGRKHWKGLASFEGPRNHRAKS